MADKKPGPKRKSLPKKVKTRRRVDSTYASMTGIRYYDQLQEVEDITRVGDYAFYVSDGVWLLPNGS